MAIDVHIVEMEKHGVRIATLQNAHSRIRHAGIGIHVQCVIGIVSQDVVIDGCPMANRMGVEIGIFRFKSFHEGGEPLKIAPSEVVASYPM